MEASQTMTANSKITDSLSSIDFDAESDSFHATYDSTYDSTSLAVVSVVATALGKDPQALPSLQSVIDTDALDKLTTKSAIGLGADSLSFRYGGFQITVTNEDVVEATSIGDA